MGRVAGSYGVRGWVKVAPDDAAEEGLAGAKEWWVGADAYEVSAARIHGATVVGKLAGIDTREQALALTREVLPEPEEGKYYLADLVGLEVVNEQGEALGVVTQTYSNGAHDVIEVTGDRTRLIPWVSAVVKEVDLPKKQIHVEWGADW
jgi:16S rRNA processing protein RimM